MDLVKVIMMVISLIVVAILLPYGIVYMAAIGDTYILMNQTWVLFADAVNPAVTTLLEVLIPLIVCIGIAIGIIREVQ